MFQTSRFARIHDPPVSAYTQQAGTGLLRLEKGEEGGGRYNRHTAYIENQALRQRLSACPRVRAFSVHA